MKNRGKILVVAIFLAYLHFGFSADLLEMIKKINENNLKGYVQPLITSFGEATGSGLYHTAQTHNLLGFDIGLKAMWIPIPKDAKTFVAKVMALSSNLADTIFIDETTATVFGESGQDPVSAPSGYYPIPSVFPGGLNLPGLPFVMPQLSVGLIKGSEVMLRYIPLPFEEAKVQIFGVGIKAGLNNLFGLKFLPVDVAVQGVYQVFNIGDIVKSSTFCANIHTSKTFSVLTPYLGIGYENTNMNFAYDFNYQVPGQTQPITQSINISLSGENHFRMVVGLSLKFAVFLIHADYNLAKYPSFNGGLGLTFR
ncbi:MAG: DUF6588 family protein [candidate division WOR-3 bacterium]